VSLLRILSLDQPRARSFCPRLRIKDLREKWRLESIEPELVVCLGATAAQSLMGLSFRITKERGNFFPHHWAKQLVATVHPSAILRAPEKYEEEYELFVRDLRVIAGRVKELDVTG